MEIRNLVVVPLRMEEAAIVIVAGIVDEQLGQSKPPILFPPGIDGPDTNGDGGVYEDMDDPATEEAYRAKTSCCQEDMAIMEYFIGLYGQRANYALWGQNCRDFSKAVFDYCKNYFSDKCK